MKKLIYITAVITGVLLMATSCKKLEAEKDVKNAVAKLEYFNKMFAEYYADGTITGIADNTGEYSGLRDIANEYYELINKINTNIQEEAEKAKKGKKTQNYEAKYKEQLAAFDAKIKEQTALFQSNLKILENLK